MDSIFDESFKDHLLNNFQSDFQQKIRYSEYIRLIEFLIDQGIIPKKKIRIYTVLHEYRFLFAQKRFKNKTQLIKAMAEKYGLHENTVWNIVRNHQLDFEANEAE